MSEYLWGIYKLFHDPPGTPRDLKCVGCKVAAGGMSIGVTGACIYGAVRAARTSYFKASLFGLTACMTTSAAAVLFRMAYDHNELNKQLIEIRAREIRKQRLKNSEELGKSTPHNNLT